MTSKPIARVAQGRTTILNLETLSPKPQPAEKNLKSGMLGLRGCGCWMLASENGPHPKGEPPCRLRVRRPRRQHSEVTCCDAFPIFGGLKLPLSGSAASNSEVGEVCHKSWKKLSSKVCQQMLIFLICAMASATWPRVELGQDLRVQMGLPSSPMLSRGFPKRDWIRQKPR